MNDAQQIVQPFLAYPIGAVHRTIDTTTEDAQVVSLFNCRPYSQGLHKQNEAENAEESN